MSHSLHEAAYAKARAAIKAGRVTDSPWSAPSEGERDQADCLGSEKSYPAFDGDKVSRHAVAAIHSRAAQQGDEEISDAADRLMKLLDKRKVQADRDVAGEYLVLSTGGDFQQAVTIGADWSHPKTRNGQTCHYFWKEALPGGQTFYDRKGRRWQFDRSRVARMVDTLHLALSRGIEPFAPVAHSSDARNLGYIVDARVNAKGNLELLHQFIGDAARDEALSKKTSICVLTNFTDEQGNEYEDLIEHNAVVPNPRLGNLDDFKPALAASRGQAIHAVVLELAAPTSQEDLMIPVEFRKLVGAAENATDDQVFQLATKAVTDARKEAKDAADLKLSLSRDLEKANTKIQELSITPPAKPAKPSAEQLHYLGQTLKLSRDEAAKAIGSEAVNAAQKRYLGSDPYDVGVLALSRESTDDDAKLADGLRRCIDFLDLAKLAKPPARGGEKTGPYLQASRTDPDGKDDDAEADRIRNEAEARKQKELDARGIK